MHGEPDCLVQVICEATAASNHGKERATLILNRLRLVHACARNVSDAVFSGSSESFFPLNISSVAPLDKSADRVCTGGAGCLGASLNCHGAAWRVSGELMRSGEPGRSFNPGNYFLPLRATSSSGFHVPGVPGCRPSVRPNNYSPPCAPQ